MQQKQYSMWSEIFSLKHITILTPNLSVTELIAFCLNISINSYIYLLLSQHWVAQSQLSWYWGTVLPWISWLHTSPGTHPADLHPFSRCGRGVVPGVQAPCSNVTWNWTDGIIHVHCKSVKFSDNAIVIILLHLPVVMLILLYYTSSSQWQNIYSCKHKYSYENHTFENIILNFFLQKICGDDSFKSKQPYKYYKIHQCFVPPLTPLAISSLCMCGAGARYVSW